MLEIRLLGQFDLRLDGQPVELPSRPAQSLLAYLALSSGVAHRRERLAGLLWPDIPESDARRNLRRALWHIRKAAGGQAPLQTDDITAAFEAGPQVWVDALTLTQKNGRERTVDELIEIVSAYGGELLPGFYDEWVIVERERLQAVFESRIKLLLDRLAEAQCWEEVLEWGERWLALSGAAEPAYRALMAAYAAQGDSSKVGYTYQRCVEALNRDLGVEPSEETHNLYMLLSRKGQAHLGAALIHPFQGLKDHQAKFIRAGQEGPGIIKPSESFKPEEFSEAEPPFKGLQFFDEADAGIFFGREVLTARLLDRLSLAHDSQGDGSRVSGERVLFVVGASGSGKSSLVRAGLVPAIRRGREGKEQTRDRRKPGWETLILTPTTHPLEILATSLTRELESVTAAAALIDDMRRDLRSLRLFLHKMTAPRLIVVDQMEELFTLCRDEEERQAYVDNLLTASEGEHCKLVFTLRADFYAHCAQFEYLRAALAAHQEYIGPMSAVELRRAIEEPAHRSGYVFEEGLVDLMLREVGNEPGSLPLLSHALLETWKRRQGRNLTLAGYAEAGGVHGAIAHTAEAVYTRLSQEQQRIARNIFIRLTEFGEGMSVDELPAPDTRRRAAPEELIPRLEDRPRVEEVLNLLAEARLLTVGEGSVEVAHEALIREWPALRAWLSEDRDGLRLHRRLTEAVQSWEELECEPGELYRGVRLAQALEWAAAHADELNDLERDFLAASQALAGQEAAEREAARLREVEAARRFALSEQRRAEEQSRSAQRLRWLAAGLAVFLLAAVLMASLALQQRDRVQSQAHLTTSRELAASALSNLDIDPERSILLSLRALQNSDTQEAENSLHRSVQASRLLKVIKTKNQYTKRLVISPDEQRMAVTSISQSYEFVTEIFDLNSGKLLRSLPGGLAADSWPDGRRLATIRTGAGGKTVITFWDANSGQELTNLSREDLPPLDKIYGNFNPNWTLVAESFVDGTTTISKLDTGERLLTLGKSGEPPNQTIAFSPDGKRLLAIVDNSPGIWDTSTGQKLVTLPSSDFGIPAAQFHPKKDQIAIAMGPVVKIFDTKTGEVLLTLSGHTGFVQGIHYSHYGEMLATTGADSLIIIWDAANGQRLMTLSGHTGAVISPLFFPTGDRLATSSSDGTVRIWDVSRAGDHEAASFEDSYGTMYTSIAYSPDGERLAVSGGPNPGEIVDATTGRTLISLRGKFSNWQGSTAFSPDGVLLASTSGEKDAYIWDAASGKKLRTLTGHRDWIGDLAFSPDGKRLATISFDGTAKIWDPTSGRELFSVQAFTDPIKTVAILGIDFSPDGSRFATAGGYISKIWDTRTGKELLALPEQPELVYSVAFSPDGGRIAIGVAYNVGASIWDATTGKKFVDLLGHQGSVQAILFSRDGTQVFTGSVDGTIKVWDAATGQEQLTLTRQSAQITGLALSPDGTRLAASSDNGTARVYLLRIQDLVDAALQRLTRWFTPQECLEYLHTDTCPVKP